MSDAQEKKQYLKYISFETSEEKNVISWKVFWAAILTVFLIANAPPRKLIAGLHAVLPGLDKLTVDFLLSEILIPLKAILFFLAFLVLAYPVAVSLIRPAELWRELGKRKVALSAFFIFVFLSFLTVPYECADNVSSSFGLSGLGRHYGNMSLSPFSMDLDYCYGRLLKPAVAYFLQMKGLMLFYVFSLICTYLLILVSLVFLESKISDETDPGRFPDKPLYTQKRFWAYVSVMTSTYVMTCFQWPGYPEQFAFILILLMASVPMNSQARLGSLVLCLISHDASVFSLTAMVLFCFPKKEKVPAFLAIAFFYAILFASYRFSVLSALAGHGSLARGVVWRFVFQRPVLVLKGAFFTYKLYWIIFLYAACRLWFQNGRGMLAAIASIVFLSGLSIFLGWDTTRLLGFGFLGILIALCFLINQFGSWPKLHRYALISLMIINIFMPSYNQYMRKWCKKMLPYDAPNCSRYPYPGLYGQIDKAAIKLWVKIKGGAGPRSGEAA